MTTSSEFAPASPALALYRSVLEAMAEGVIVVREDGCLLAANEAAAKMLDLGPADLPLADFFARRPLVRGDGTAFSPEEHPFRVALREGAPRQSQLLGITRPDGTRRWLSCGVYPVPPAQPGEPRVLMVAFEALALQRQADIEMRAVTDFSPVGVYLKDQQGNCLYVNRRWEELTGLSFAEARNHGWMRLIHPEDAPAATAAWEAATRNGGTFQADLRIVRPDGRVVWVSVRAGRVDLADGALTGYAGTVIDITDRKAAEAALVASEQRLRACIESTPYVAVQWYDEQGRVTFWNPASELIFGWPAGEALGRTLDQLIHTPEETRAFVELLREVKASGAPHGPVEYEFRRKNGTTGVCLSTVFPIPAEDGQPRFACMDVDISARRQADRLMVGQHSILELIALGTPIKTVLEQITRFIEVNSPGLCGSILLLEPDGVTLRHAAGSGLPATYLRAMDGVRIDQCASPCCAAVARRETVIVPDVLADPRWAGYRPLAEAHGLRACWSTPLFSAQGEVLGVLACHHRAPHQPSRDALQLVELGISLVGIVVERDRAQAALRASEQRFRLLVDNSHDIVVELSLAGAVRYASANLASYLGLTDEALRVERLLERVHPDDRVPVANALRQPHGAATFRFRRGEGEWLWFDAWGRHFTAAGGETRAVIFARDVTERKAAEAAQARLEIQLRQSQRLEAIGTLAGGVAHDFNNILAGILGHVELLSLDLPPDSPLQESVRQVLGGAIRARDLVRRILTFSRSNEPRREPARLSATVKEALKLLRASLPSSIEFTADWPAEEPLILADPGQIHQIIMNVGFNAAHAIGSRPGSLKVVVAVVELDASFTDGHPPLLPGRHVRLTVADDGCGMDAGLQQRVFDPFFTTKPPGQGTGLGLSMVHGIVQMHQGAVTVTSQPGAGASFDFYFRAMEEKAPDDSRDEMRLPVGDGQRIMVVDDEEAVLWAAQNFLTRLNYAATGFPRATEALEAFAQAPQDFDAILTDLTMPQLSGLDLARKLRAIRPDVPVIVMSGYLLGVEDDELRDAGVAHVVLKPFSVQALAEAVAGVLRGAGEAGRGV
ncbi:MAG: multi-sensor hybrid histidine kinase [Limisphaerales bacterium]|nr:MAG: multi-sensor hybrid histidine kinase [Limisphaerales bacterium]KAG0506951.1 MAG: multi-sensor hybrid histidine kinase [Limisphaerales bacterium]TXT49199.1 MAG: multi-sensor hybrid histidine kinase [Limisphaerales bacterium]